MGDFLGETVEWIDLDDGRQMAFSNAGMITLLSVNIKATFIFDQLASHIEMPFPEIYGNVIICTMYEIQN